MKQRKRNILNLAFPIIVLLIGFINLILIYFDIKYTIYYLTSTLISISILFALLIKEKNKIKDIDNFIGSLTHELKTPLATTSLIIENLRERSNREYENEYRIIDEENKRIRAIVERILESSKFKKYSLKREEFDINQLISNISKHYIDSFNSVNIECKFNKENNIIFADRLHLNNAINTLIDNSIKYNDCSPIIEIETKINGKCLEIRIKDNGIGIPKKERKKVFKKYYRARNAENRKGFGIGLSYVKDVVLAHKGRVFIDKEIENGTRIIILLPIF